MIFPLFVCGGDVIHIGFSPVRGTLKGKEVIPPTGRKSLVSLSFVFFMSNLRFSVVLEALDNAEPAFTRKSSYVCAFVLLCIYVFVY